MRVVVVDLLLPLSMPRKEAKRDFVTSVLGHNTSLLERWEGRGSRGKSAVGTQMNSWWLLR